MDHMTAKVSCFARAYHYKNNTTWIFKDEVASILLGEAQYDAIATNMAEGIKFFAPNFEGDHKQALELIVNNQLAPSVLGRSALNEAHLWNEYRLGTKQYVLFAAGFDTFAFRSNCLDLRIFELDLPEMIEDRLAHEEKGGLGRPANRSMIACNLSEDSWKKLLMESGFQSQQKAFGSLLGISYYLSKNAFDQLLGNISEIFATGSAICFDYPAAEGSDETLKNEELAKAANEEMKAKYSFAELESMLATHGFAVREHLDSDEMTTAYFCSYNAGVHRQMSAPKGVGYFFAVKQ